MKIEFTRAEIERIILDHIKNEIAPYVEFHDVDGGIWGLPESVTVYSKEKDATQ